MSQEVWIEKGKGRTLSINVRLFTDKIAKGGEGYVQPGHAWFKGDVGFRPNPKHGIRGAGTEPIMFNKPEDLVDAIIKAAKVQGVTLFDPGSKDRIT